MEIEVHDHVASLWRGEADVGLEGKSAPAR